MKVLGTNPWVLGCQGGHLAREHPGHLEHPALRSDRHPRNYPGCLSVPPARGHRGRLHFPSPQSNLEVCVRYAFRTRLPVGIRERDRKSMCVCFLFMMCEKKCVCVCVCVCVCTYQTFATWCFRNSNVWFMDHYKINTLVCLGCLSDKASKFKTSLWTLVTCDGICYYLWHFLDSMINQLIKNISTMKIIVSCSPVCVCVCAHMRLCVCV